MSTTLIVLAKTPSNEWCSRLVADGYRYFDRQNWYRTLFGSGANVLGEEVMPTNKKFSPSGKCLRHGFAQPYRIGGWRINSFIMSWEGVVLASLPLYLYEKQRTRYTTA